MQKLNLGVSSNQEHMYIYNKCTSMLIDSKICAMTEELNRGSKLSEHVVVEVFLYLLQYGGTAKSTEHSINELLQWPKGVTLQYIL